MQAFYSIIIFDMQFLKSKFSDKQSVLFSFTTCFCMVIGMSLYNVIREQGFENGFWFNFLGSIVSGYFVAWILSFFIFAPLAKKITFSLPIDKNNKAKI